MGKTADHLYSNVGLFTVVLDVSDGEFNSTASITVIIEGTPGLPPIPPPPPPPSAERPWANANGPYNWMAMDEIYLSSAGSQGFNPEYCWDLDISNGIQYSQCYDIPATFADWADGYGDTAYGPFPIISYPQPGNYTITMIIRSRYGDNIAGRDVVYRYNFTTTNAIITEHATIEVDAGKDKSVDSGEKTTFSGHAKVYSKFEPEYFVGCRWDFESDGIWDVSQEYDRAEKLQEIICPGIHTYTLNASTKVDTIFNASFAVTAEGELALYPTSNSSAGEIPVGLPGCSTLPASTSITSPTTPVTAAHCRGRPPSPTTCSAATRPKPGTTS